MQRNANDLRADRLAASRDASYPPFMASSSRRMSPALDSRLSSSIPKASVGSEPLLPRINLSPNRAAAYMEPMRPPSHPGMPRIPYLSLRSKARLYASTESPAECKTNTNSDSSPPDPAPRYDQFQNCAAPEIPPVPQSPFFGCRKPYPTRGPFLWYPAHFLYYRMPRAQTYTQLISLPQYGRLYWDQFELPNPPYLSAPSYNPNSNREQYNPRAWGSACSPRPNYAHAPRAESSQAREGRHRHANTPDCCMPSLVGLASPMSATGLRPSSKDCTICMEECGQHEFPTRKITSKCSHQPSTCKACLAQWIEECFQNHSANRIMCPEDSCNEELEYEDIREFADTEIFRRYEDLSAKKILDADPNVIYCIGPNCGSAQVHEGGENFPLFTCVNCGFQWCIRHKIAWHDKHTCDEFDATLRDPKFKSAWELESQADSDAELARMMSIGWDGEDNEGNEFNDEVVEGTAENAKVQQRVYSGQERQRNPHNSLFTAYRSFALPIEGHRRPLRCQDIPVDNRPLRGYHRYPPQRTMHQLRLWDIREGAWQSQERIQHVQAQVESRREQHRPARQQQAETRQPTAEPGPGEEPAAREAIRPDGDQREPEAQARRRPRAARQEKAPDGPARAGTDNHSDNTPCQEAIRKRQEEEAASERTVSKTSRPCPSCLAPIEKNDGCNHMTCRACEFEFCYICLVEWGSEACLAHMWPPGEHPGAVAMW